MSCKEFVLVQFAANDCHLIGFYYVRSVNLMEVEIKPFFPYMVAESQKCLRVGFRTHLFCINFKVAEWQRRDESAGGFET